ncbi:MAG: GTPase [Holophagae bacterium]|nr:MAG: GTPase [Holophagae bacterium]
MTEQETRAILSICLMAAFADGTKDEREREQVRRVAATLTGDSAADLTAISRDVLLKRSALEETAAALGSPELRQLAYEMAVGVCDADEARSAAESEFLDRLRGALDLSPSAIEPFHAEAKALAAEPVAVPAAAPSPQSAELDRMILNSAILNGALELLPQTLATMAIIPLQMKMVYRIGKTYGFELDRGHIKDFLATVGVGLSSQYLERFGRRLAGGLFGTIGGSLGRRLGSAAAGSAFSFATTYALGQVAKNYYAGGRTLDAQRLKEAFASLLGEAKTLEARYLPEIRERARTINPASLLDLVRRPV